MTVLGTETIKYLSYLYSLLAASLTLCRPESCQKEIPRHPGELNAHFETCVIVHSFWACEALA